MYRGLLSALEDPYSVYYSSEELTELMQQSEGVYYGIGAVMGMDAETSLPRISSSTTFCTEMPRYHTARISITIAIPVNIPPMNRPLPLPLSPCLGALCEEG